MDFRCLLLNSLNGPDLLGQAQCPVNVSIMCFFCKITYKQCTLELQKWLNSILKITTPVQIQASSARHLSSKPHTRKRPKCLRRSFTCLQGAMILFIDPFESLSCLVAHTLWRSLSSSGL